MIAAPNHDSKRSLCTNDKASGDMQRRKCLEELGVAKWAKDQ